MSKYFNVNGNGDPELHYMVDISDKLQKIKAIYLDFQMLGYGEFETEENLFRLFQMNF